MNIKVYSIAFIIALSSLLGCGGGGGGSESGACSALSNASRIAGGDSCYEGQANVAVVFAESAAGEASCTGSYISRTAILTAAHCFLGRPTQVTVASSGGIREGAQYIIHPAFNGAPGSPFDMAIVKVNEPIPGGPLPLLLSTDPNIGDEVVAYGYGLDQNGRQFIERIEANEAPLKATYSTYAGYRSGVVTILSSGSGSPCPGDSGGPVVARNVNGDYGIIGITIAGPNGCSAQVGRPVALASVKSRGAIDFISTHVPDAAVN